MNPVAADAPCYTPAGLSFNEPRHLYTFNQRPLLSVTGVLREAGLIDVTHATAADAERGTRVHAAIELLHDKPNGHEPLSPDLEPYVCAYTAFLAESAFRVDASEERLCDPALHVAGTLDLRGAFPDSSTRVDVIDVKTGSVPPWVGYQVAGYVALLPVGVGVRARRWCLQLRADATYRFIALTGRADRAVFFAALTVALGKRGWL